MHTSSFDNYCSSTLAVGTLRIDSEEVVTHLMWAARFEQLPEVRAQVCHTLSLLRVRDERIVKVLKDLLIVEDEEIVLRYVQIVLWPTVCISLMYMYMWLCTCTYMPFDHYDNHCIFKPCLLQYMYHYM